MIKRTILLLALVVTPCAAQPNTVPIVKDDLSFGTRIVGSGIKEVLRVDGQGVAHCRKPIMLRREAEKRLTPASVTVYLAICGVTGS